jgi:transketolase
LASLRGTPNMSVWRPADAVESAVAWKAAIQRADGPTCLVFSRQNLPHRERDALQVENISKGGYVLSPETGVLEAIIIATGSEIDLAMQAQQRR